MELNITQSVGRNANNKARDVKLVKALLNAYHRSKRMPVLQVNDLADAALDQAIVYFQENQQQMAQADGQVSSSQSASFTSLLNFLESTRTQVTIVPPEKGQLTFEVEGNEGGRYHSRILHVPSSTSGLTLGRGYDMKNRSEDSVWRQLSNAGVDDETAKIISRAAGMSGTSADQFIIDNDLLDFEISADTQLELFNTVYIDYEATVERICKKSDVVSAYGETDWNGLDNTIKTVLVDLCFRGDYQGASRKIIQRSVADNNLQTFRQLISNRSLWSGWPEDRFIRRRDFLDRQGS